MTFAKMFLAAMVVAAGGACSVAIAAGTGFSFQDKPGEYLDVLLDGRIVARYMDAHDTSTLERRVETYKPYLHVFDAEGKAPITKGAGGLFPHHRGIFIGYRQIDVGGKHFDRWHMPDGEIVHQKFLEQKADADEATFTSLTHWNDDKGEPILIEERTTTIRKAPAPGRLLIDFTSKLTATKADLTLDGDPEHSGVQYRPANELDTRQTTYVFPRENAKPHQDVDYPWVGETYVLNGRHYSVVEFNHPDDPKGTRFSAYRDYGRFGAFPKAKVDAGKSLILKYRFLIVDGEMPPAEMIQKVADDFDGAKGPSQTPKLTILPAEQPTPPAKKDPAK